MKLISFSIQNFRGYEEKTTIQFDDLNFFVGKNDVGKSTILEALDIFFNEASTDVKLSREDINVDGLDKGNNIIEFRAKFCELPEQLVLDTSTLTNLNEEFLLNSEKGLEIIKRYHNGSKSKWFILANHPTNPNCNNLFNLTNTQLKKIITDNDIECENLSKNSVIRKAIYNHYLTELELREQELELNKGDGKDLPRAFEKHFPLYCLFQSDRKNSDGDQEVQNPLQYAVKEIFSDPDIQETLQTVSEQVETKLRLVAANTLEKLREMNEDVANTLSPVIPPSDTLKWKDVFKNVSITSDRNIPINKRGSGVKRLVLLNFFRAEAERKKQENSLSSIIYAIEEPETSQHGEHQVVLANALIELASAENTQVIATTHSSIIVKQLGFEHLKHIKNESSGKVIVQIEEKQLPFPSLNEVNYCAFGDVTEEYHNELYEHLLYLHGGGKIQEFDNRFFQEECHEPRDHPWKGVPNRVTIHTFIRNQIHHRKDNGTASKDDLLYSIEWMRSYLINANQG